jgi:4-amino-4-deoxy-L-arabinose transferase-like glycosyltransferase
MYYTAAVESMLQSWKNFFFIAAEPGGSVSVDKPPLGLWLQAASAYFLGVNGFAVMLPQILAGIAAVPVLYHLVKRTFGSWAGLSAALILAITPVVVAVDRNNTMDSTLVLTLLLAAWAFLKATDEGRLRWLLLGGVLVGLGFNIKMLQAYLVLPAFYGLYLLGSRQSWWVKAVNLAATTVVLLVVSLSWAVAVDLTPADERPYVGSSEDNTVMELILGHNGLNRLVGGGGNRPQAPNDDDSDGGIANPPNGVVSSIPDGAANGGNPLPSADRNGPPAMDPFNGPTQGGAQPSNSPSDGAMGNDEIGQAGLLRLLSPPLSNEIAWLLPIALLCLVVVAISQHLRWPPGSVHKAWLLWGGWLLTALAFFTVAEFYHAYYLTMLAAPLAAIASAGLAALGRWIRDGSARAGLALALMVVASVVYQGFVGLAYIDTFVWYVPSLGMMIVAMAALAAILISDKVRWIAMVLTLALAAVVAAPSLWSALTALDNFPNVNLPQAYEASGDQGGNRRMAVDDKLLEFLLANTTDSQYLMAVRSSMDGASYVLETGRPVLYMGGFNGSDPVVSAADLQTMTTEGDLRYILWAADNRAGSSSPEIARWLTESCQPVLGLGLAAGGVGTRPSPDGDGPPASAGAGPGMMLYECDGQT